MADTERLFLFLAGGDPEQLLDDVRATRSPALLQYARSWLSLIAQEFRAELQSALTTARGADEGSRATKAQQWQATVIERVADAGAGVELTFRLGSPKTAGWTGHGTRKFPLLHFSRS